MNLFVVVGLVANVACATASIIDGHALGAAACAFFAGLLIGQAVTR